MATAGVLVSILDDLYLKVYDRTHGVSTSGHIDLGVTSLGDGAKVRGHRYRPVNAWGFHAFLAGLEPRPTGRFVDLGSGLGRACFLAAQSGMFSRVRGVEFVPEFCNAAQANARAFAQRHPASVPVEILTADAVDYASRSDDDFVFMFNAFPVPVLEQVMDRLIRGARERRQRLLVLYSERIMETSPTLESLRTTGGVQLLKADRSWGQGFYLFTIG